MAPSVHRLIAPSAQGRVVPWPHRLRVSLPDLAQSRHHPVDHGSFCGSRSPLSQSPRVTTPNERTKGVQPSSRVKRGATRQVSGARSCRRAFAHQARRCHSDVLQTGHRGLTLGRCASGRAHRHRVIPNKKAVVVPTYILPNKAHKNNRTMERNTKALGRPCEVN